jgi:hypothetical protein
MPLTFHCKHKIVERVLVLFVGFGIVLLHILLDGLLHDLDGTLKKRQNRWPYEVGTRTSRLDMASNEGKGGVVKVRRNRSA